MNALQIIQLRAPQWATDPRVSGLIEYAREVTGVDAFGLDSERAIALRVLHIFATEAMRGGNPGASVSTSGQGHAGQITSEAEGQLSKSFGVNSQWANQRYGNLSTTIYGQELIELIRMNVMSPLTRQPDPDSRVYLDTW
jgi:hypothetical protein